MNQVLYDRIVSYLQTGRMPEDLTFTQRTSLRLEKNNYVLEMGRLFYKVETGNLLRSRKKVSTKVLYMYA